MDGMPSAAEQPWNLNIHHDAWLDAQVPDGARRALDVGSGDGFLAGRLARRVPDVSAVEIDLPVLRRAQARFAGAPIRWVNGDVMAVELAAASFDAVVSNAALHHIPDTRAALARLAGLVAPGGKLALVTFVRFSFRYSLWHLKSASMCAVVNRLKRKWEHTAPIRWPPPYTLAQLVGDVRAVLPGAQVQRSRFGRVLITWSPPTPT